MTEPSVGGAAERPAEPDVRQVLKDLLAFDHHHPFDHDTIRQEEACPHCKALTAAKRALRSPVGEPREPPEPSETLQKAEALLRDERYAMSPVIRATLEGLAESVRAAEQMLDDGWFRQKIGLLRAGAPPNLYDYGEQVYHLRREEVAGIVVDVIRQTRGDGKKVIVEADGHDGLDFFAVGEGLSDENAERLRRAVAILDWATRKHPVKHIVTDEELFAAAEIALEHLRALSGGGPPHEEDTT